MMLLDLLAELVPWIIIGFLYHRLRRHEKYRKEMHDRAQRQFKAIETYKQIIRDLEEKLNAVSR